MLADGLTKNGIDRALLHSCSNDCKYVCKQESAMHSKIFGSATKTAEDSKEEGPIEDDDAMWAPGQMLQLDSKPHNTKTDTASQIDTDTHIDIHIIST